MSPAAHPSGRGHLRDVTDSSTSPNDVVASDKAWKPHDGYSEDIYFLRSTNQKGFGERIQARLAPEIMGAIGTMVESRLTPYKNISEFIRDAAWHRLHYLNEKVGASHVNRMLANEIMEATAERYAREVEAHTRLMTLMHETMTTALNAQDWSTLAAMIADFEDHVDELEDPWHGQAVQIIAGYRGRVPVGFVHVLEERDAKRESDD